MPDHHDDLDERIARLQRASYGADASDAERAAARAELAALHDDASDASGPRPAGDPGAGAGTAPAMPEDRMSPDASEPPTTAATAGTHGSDPTRTRNRGRRGARTVIVSVLAALLVGAGTGWALGSASEPSVGAGDDAPVEWTRAWQVFDRRVGDGDLVRHPPPEESVELDESSRRLLVTRSDGVRLVAARTADGGNACLILVLPVGRPGVACTELGRFPADGLRAEVSAEAVGDYVAIWYADGRVTVNAAAVPSG
ncbi:hypothetical protein [Agromyces arachidis]|uniref:hypothetical protein n=1 Tax=Agromyces arachidis TaxID=766966 RepID=UPI00405731C4